MEEIIKLHSELGSKLIRLITNYAIKNFSLKNSEHPKFYLRDSILHRIDSLIFHLKNILINKDEITRLIKNISIDPNTGFTNLKNYKSSMLFLFEDIIFNIASLFDYIGNTIGMFYLGPNGIKLKWNGIVNASHDSKHKISNYKIARIVIEKHRSYVDDFYNYRSATIHYKHGESSNRKIINLDTLHLTPYDNHFVNVPVLILKTIKSIKNELNKENYNYFTVSYWMVKKTLIIYKEILDVIIEEIEPTIQENLKNIEKNINNKNR